MIFADPLKGHSEIVNLKNTIFVYANRIKQILCMHIENIAPLASNYQFKSITPHLTVPTAHRMNFSIAKLTTAVWRNAVGNLPLPI